MRTVDERTANTGEAIRAAMRSAGVNIRVAMPGIVEEFDRERQTVAVRPAIREVLRSGGAEREIEIPPLVDVPIVLPRAGGYLLALAPRAGDECLVVFADSCIDGWWQSGGVQSQAERRRHDLSDGFAILGPWSQPNLPALPESGARLQDEAGETYVAIEGGKVYIQGDLYINGSEYRRHTHSVSEGAGRTGGVS